MKEKSSTKSNSGEREKLLETYQYSSNLIKEVNTWAVLLKRYWRTLLKIPTLRNGPKNQKEKEKNTTIYKPLDPRDKINRLWGAFDMFPDFFRTGI